MEKIKLVLPIMALCVLVACTPIASKKCQSALDAGNLKEAELYLKEIKDAEERRHYGGMLIDEYLSIGNLDRAIYVFERITGHCSMYNMKYKGLYDNAAYTEKYSRKIYDALIKEGRYDEAWNYHARNYENEDYAKEHNIIYIVLEDKVLEYQVFSSYTAAVISDTYRLYFENEERKQSAIHGYLGQALWDMGITPEVDDHILTLSTCTGSGLVDYDYRWVVQGVLVREYGEEPTWQKKRVTLERMTL